MTFLYSDFRNLGLGPLYKNLNQLDLIKDVGKYPIPNSNLNSLEFNKLFENNLTKTINEVALKKLINKSHDFDKLFLSNIYKKSITKVVPEYEKKIRLKKLNTSKDDGNIVLDYKKDTKAEKSNIKSSISQSQKSFFGKNFNLREFSKFSNKKLDKQLESWNTISKSQIMKDSNKDSNVVKYNKELDNEELNLISTDKSDNNKKIDKILDEILHIYQLFLSNSELVPKSHDLINESYKGIVEDIQKIVEKLIAINNKEIDWELEANNAIEAFIKNANDLIEFINSKLEFYKEVEIYPNANEDNIGKADLLAIKNLDIQEKLYVLMHYLQDLDESLSGNEDEIENGSLDNKNFSSYLESDYETIRTKSKDILKENTSSIDNSFAEVENKDDMGDSIIENSFENESGDYKYDSIMDSSEDSNPKINRIEKNRQSLYSNKAREGVYKYNFEEIDNINHSNNIFQRGNLYNNTLSESKFNNEQNADRWKNTTLGNLGDKRQSNLLGNKETIYNNFSNYVYTTSNHTKYANISDIRNSVVNAVIEKADLYKFTDGKKTLTVQLQPDSLGKIQIELIVKDGVIKGRLIAENEVVKENLEKLIPNIVESLDKNEIKVSEIKVEVMSTKLSDNYNSHENLEHRNNTQDYKEELAFRVNGLLKGMNSNLWRYEDDLIESKVDLTSEIQKFAYGVRNIDVRV